MSNTIHATHFRRQLALAAFLLCLFTLLTPLAAQAAGFAATGPLAVARQNHTATLLPNGKLLIAGGYGSADNALSSVELYDPAAGTWTTTGSLATARYQHTATLLPNGKVLVAGGNDSGYNASNSAELYDPAAGTWTATGSLATARTNHTATLLPNGKVLVAGGSGSGSSALNSVELYDPAAGTWTTTGTLVATRYQHTATLLPNGKVLVAAGVNNSGYLKSAELYDPAVGTWTTTGALAAVRDSHTATLLPSGKVLVAGGFNGDVYVGSAELYDPGAGIWTTTGPLATARDSHTATLLPNGKVLVAGGFDGRNNFNSAELYDPAAGTWTTTAPLAAARSGHTAALLPNGKVLFAAGYNFSSGYLNSAELYDYAAGTWATAGSLAAAREYQTATLLPNGKVLVAGGLNGNVLSSAELYDAATGTWSTTGPLASARYRHTATLLPNGKVLVAGGYDSNDRALSSAELYDPAAGTWTTTAPLATARYYHTATLLPNGKLLVAGGLSGSGASLNSVELYDYAAGTWAGTGPLADARRFHTATLLPNGKLLVAGGYNGSFLNSAELYDPVAGSWTITGPLATARALHTATLLPNGMLLAAAGFNSNGELNSAELYDPVAGAWTTTGPLATARDSHTATLLPNGKLLVAAGNASGNSALSSVELYDPAAGTWTTTAPLAAARVDNAATLLPNGKVLVAEGYNGSDYLNSAELYDVGLGYSASYQATITTATSPLTLGNALTLSGTQFTGYQNESASGGATNDSASNNPVVQITSLSNEQQVFLTSGPANPWTATSYKSLAVSGLPLGYASVRVFVNGIPSAAQIVLVGNPAVETPSLIVTTPSDVVNNTDGLISLREALDYAANLSGPQTIKFNGDPSIGSISTGTGIVNFYDGAQHTITLNGTELRVRGSVTVTGSGAAVLTLDAHNASRVFNIDDDVTSTLSGMTISNGNDTSDNGGGGIFNNSSTLTVSNCTFSGNSASYGGGFFNGGTMTVSNSTLSGNSAFEKGGGLENEGTLTMSNCTLIGNSAHTDIGGIYNDGGTLTVNNSTFSGNSGQVSGCIFSHGTATVSNSTFSGNSSGISNFGDSGLDGVMTFSNTILSNNTGGNLRNQSSGGSATITSLGHNLSDGADGAFLNATGDIINTNPLLGALANNGGPTQTFALLAGSPAIDAGSNALIPNDPATGQPYTTDQRGSGHPRILNSIVDIGAFEHPPATTVTSVTTSGAQIDANGNGDLNTSKIVIFTVNFSANVSIDTNNGMPTLSLNNGANATSAYYDESTTNQMTFTYTVSAGDDIADLAITDFSLKGGTITTDGVNADLSGVVSNPAGILQIDTVPPTITNVSISPNTTQVSVNTTLTYTVTLSEQPAPTNIAAILTNAGTATITIGAITPLSATTFQVQITPTTLGTVQLLIPNTAVVTDLAGNLLAVPITDTHVINVVDSHISITSGPTIYPNPAFVDLAVTFFVAATPDNATFSWDFGDGLPAQTGANPTHIFSTAGMYTAKVTATDPASGGTVTGLLTFDVVNPGDTALPETTPLFIASGKIRFYPAFVRIKGTIDIPADTRIFGLTATVVVNGLIRTFTLNKQGNGRSSGGNVTFRSSKSNAKKAAFMIFLKGNDNPVPNNEVIQTLLTTGCSVDASGRPKRLLIEVMLGNVLGTYATPELNYNGKPFIGLATFGQP